MPYAFPLGPHHLAPQPQPEGARSLRHHPIGPEGEPPAAGSGGPNAAGGQHQFGGDGATGHPGGREGMVGEAGLHPGRTPIS